MPVLNTESWNDHTERFGICCDARAELRSMNKKGKIEWFLRVAVFGAALIVGLVGAWSVWSTFQDYGALSLFILVFTLIFVLLIYIVRRRNLGMLETR